MTHHTPGPWQIAGCRQKLGMNGSVSDSHIVGPDTVPVAGVFYSDRKNLHTETLANAKLIAAAPDLLAALQSMVDTFQYAIDDQTAAQEDVMMAALKAARATVAKATQPKNT